MPKGWTGSVQIEVTIEMAQHVLDTLHFNNWKKEDRPKVVGLEHLDSEVTNTVTVLGVYPNSEGIEGVMTLAYRPHMIGQRYYDKHGLFSC